MNKYIWKLSSKFVNVISYFNRVSLLIMNICLDFFTENIFKRVYGKHLNYFALYTTGNRRLDASVALIQ